MEIGKELFEAVTGYKVTTMELNTSYVRIEGGDGYGDYGFYEETYNDLFFKCKEWAFNKGYRLDSATVPKGDFTSSYCIIREWTQPIDRYVKVINSSTEQQAVFDACQYILDN